MIYLPIPGLVIFERMKDENRESRPIVIPDAISTGLAVLGAFGLLSAALVYKLGILITAGLFEQATGGIRMAEIIELEVTTAPEWRMAA